MRWAPNRVLIVEDTHGHQLFEIAIVNSLWPDARVDVAENANRAIEALNSEVVYDLVLTDARLPPPGSGADVAAHALALGAPCVATSSHLCEVPGVPFVAKEDLDEKLQDAAEQAKREARR